MGDSPGGSGSLRRSARGCKARFRFVTHPPARRPCDDDGDTLRASPIRGVDHARFSREPERALRAARRRARRASANGRRRSGGAGDRAHRQRPGFLRGRRLEEPRRRGDPGWRRQESFRRDPARDVGRSEAGDRRRQRSRVRRRSGSHRGRRHRDRGRLGGAELQRGPGRGDSGDDLGRRAAEARRPSGDAPLLDGRALHGRRGSGLRSRPSRRGRRPTSRAPSRPRSTRSRSAVRTRSPKRSVSSAP